MKQAYFCLVHSLSAGGYVKPAAPDVWKEKLSAAASALVE